MSFITYTSGTYVRAIINGFPVGALRSFSERCVQDIELIRGIGSAANLTCSPSGKKYIVELQYIMPLGCDAVDPPSDPAQLNTFNIVINLTDRTLRFLDCVYESVQTSCEVGGDLICTMRAIAQTRICDMETG